MTVNCKNCEQPIEHGEQCYETRIGSVAIIELKDFSTGSPVFETEFQPDEAVEYWHVQCPIPSCDHTIDPIVPTQVEVQGSPVWIVLIAPELNQYTSKDYFIHYDWKKTAYGELKLTARFSNKETEDDFDLHYVFTKCPKCKVISSV